jgi:hypothetical protein
MMKIKKHVVFDVDVSLNDITGAIFDDDARALVRMLDNAIADWDFTQDLLVYLLGVMKDADVSDTTAEFLAALKAAYDKFGGDNA